MVPISIASSNFQIAFRMHWDSHCNLQYLLIKVWSTYLLKLITEATELRSLDRFKSFLASSDFCHLLITFANSLDPDLNVGPDRDPNCLIL